MRRVTDERVEAYRKRTDVVVRTWPVADLAVAQALVRVTHPRLAPIVDAFVADGVLHVVEQVVHGEPLERASPYSDKVLACGIELAPALQALAERGLAHGDVRPEVILRTDAGLVLVGASGLTRDAKLATPEDDMRALAAVLLPMLAPGAPENVRGALQKLADGTSLAGPSALTSAELQPFLVRLRASIPVPRGRPEVRSIQRLAFPPPRIPPRRSKRYTIRILLIVALVGLGLYALFGGRSTTPEPAKEPIAAPQVRQKDGVVFIRTTPLGDARGSTD